MTNTVRRKKWIFKPEISDELKKENKNIDPLFLQLLYNRGLSEKKVFDKFLHANKIDDLCDPFLFKDMERSVELVIEHIKNNDLIIVYGDYDADGVTAAALLAETISILKGNVDVYLPDRVSEGYGINENAIRTLHKKGAKLIITVDNGIRQTKEADIAKKLGIDLIITDHHTPPERLPDALVINPKIETDKYPFRLLAGVGVSFKFAQAIISKAKISDEVKKKILHKILDLVAIGTIADCVPVVGENRILTKIGLEIINKRKRIGLDELIDSTKNDGYIDSWHIGWLIAPRINSAGRLKHANTALELLMTNDRREAMEITKELNKNNSRRQEITESIVDEIEKQIDSKIQCSENMHIIIALCPGDNGNIWQEGVIGLAAGRICEKYYVPTLVITRSNGEF